MSKPSMSDDKDQAAAPPASDPARERRVSLDVLTEAPQVELLATMIKRSTVDPLQAGYADTDLTDGLQGKFATASMRRWAWLLLGLPALAMAVLAVLYLGADDATGYEHLVNIGFCVLMVLYAAVWVVLLRRRRG